MGETDRPEQAEILSLARARVVVSGRVQGVFFRQSCAREAREAGVTGSVVNRPDGRVEAVFQGSREAVDRLIEWCRTGPPSARVDDVSISWEPAEEHPSEFRVGWF
jgi:acylphosphatase